MTNDVERIKQGDVVTYEYHSAAYYIKQNGDRHKANGDKYLEQGMLKHAAGSFKKAARNYQKAYDLQNPLLMYCEWITPEELLKKYPINDNS